MIYLLVLFGDGWQVVYEYFVHSLAIVAVNHFGGRYASSSSFDSSVRSCFRNFG